MKKSIFSAQPLRNLSVACKESCTSILLFVSCKYLFRLCFFSFLAVSGLFKHEEHFVYFTYHYRCNMDHAIVGRCDILIILLARFLSLFRGKLLAAFRAHIQATLHYSYGSYILRSFAFEPVAGREGKTKKQNAF